MVRLKSFGIVQTAKFIAITYFVLSAIFVVPFMLILMAVGGENTSFGGFGGIFILIILLVYAVIAFIGVAIWGLIYNFFANHFGGVEFELEASTEQLQAQQPQPAPAGQTRQ